MNRFQRRFELALTMSGISARELSKRTQIAESVISQYRSGRMKPRDTERVFLLAKELNVSPGWLMGYDSTMQPTDDEIIKAFSSLSAENKLRALDYIRFLQTKEVQDV